MKKIAVIAGTPVDTQMGVDYLNRRNLVQAAGAEVNEGTGVCFTQANASVTVWESSESYGGQLNLAAAAQAAEQLQPIYLPAFENPRICHVFQMSDYETKEKRMTELFNEGLKQGAEAFFIYCNSLSAAFNYDEFGKKMGVKTVTPLNAYAKLAGQYNKLGVIAANNQATAGIEKAFTDANPACYIMGLGMLELVEAVESKLPSAEIVEKYGLCGLAEFFESNGAEAFVLGCTHFPYFKEALEKKTGLKVIDPADEMYNLIFV